jgi:CheY-like chemotaxis protein
VVEYRWVASAPVTLEVIDVAPALFTLDSSGRGQAAMLNDSGCCNSASNPAARGSIAALYATGEGQTNPPGVTGLFSAHEREADYPVPRQKVRVMVGGEPAEVVWAAEAPHTVSGLLQVNFRIPMNAPVGDAVPLVLMVGDSRSPEGLTMAVRSAVHQVLLMDEAPEMRVRLRKLLADAGYEVFTARNDLEARVKAHENPIDLVISSLATREETIAAMRKERRHLKTIVTVGTQDAESLRAADLLGAQAVLTPNMSAMDVQTRVRELVRAHPVPYVATDAILRP